MNQNFIQTITFHCEDPGEVISMLTEWDKLQASSDVTGYMGTRLLADREHLGRYLIVAEFGVVEPGVSASDEALKNNRRPETKAFAERMREIISDEPEWHHFDEVYKTDY